MATLQILRDALDRLQKRERERLVDEKHTLLVKTTYLAPDAAKISAHSLGSEQDKD